jgi:hypothetical protein
MHKSTLLLSLFVISLAVTASVFSFRRADADDTNKGKLLRHVVLFKFKADASEVQVQEVVDAFAALPKKIKQIHDFEWGTDAHRKRARVRLLGQPMTRTIGQACTNKLRYFRGLQQGQP